MVLFLPWKEFCIKYYSYSPAIKSGAEFKISSISVSPLTKTFMCEVDGESELEQIIKVVFLKQQRSIIKATHFHFYNCFLSFLFFFFFVHFIKYTVFVPGWMTFSFQNWHRYSSHTFDVMLEIFQHPFGHGRFVGCKSIVWISCSTASPRFLLDQDLVTVEKV